MVQLIFLTFRICTTITFILTTNTKAEIEITNGTKLDGLIDAYYSNDFESKEVRKREFFTQGVMDSEVNLNLAYLGSNLNYNDWHGRIALQYGTSVDANYSAENYDSLKYLQESYIGKKINDKLKLDFGIYLSHIGLESFISRDNSAYTRSLVSEFSPYYQSGIRLEYKSSDSLGMQIHLINGWQNISTNRLDPALGTQITFGKPENFQFIYNTFTGQRDDGIRLLQDFVIKIQAAKNLKLSGAIDFGYQKSELNSEGTWYGGLLICDLAVFENISIVLRTESYSDTDSIIVASESGNAFKVNSYSLGINYNPTPNLLLRTEYKRLISSNSIFKETSDSFGSQDSFLITSIGLTF